MKFKVFMVLVIGIVLAMGIAGIAQAQSVCSTMGFSTSTGLPGSAATVYGEGFAGDDVTVTFDGTVVGSGVVGEGDTFSVNFTIPAGATAGSHDIEVKFTGELSNTCPFTFAVEAASAPAIVPPVPPAALPATLPSTGFMLLPAGGLIAGGIGTLLARKRRR